MLGWRGRQLILHCHGTIHGMSLCPGQMLGDLGLKTRGWGNVSVENNHIDVFIFDFADVLNWLAKEYNEKRFSDFSQVISTSMRQLLPHEGHRCGIAKTGYYPRLSSILNWDYGKNGKGYYNDILLRDGQWLHCGNYFLRTCREVLEKNSLKN